MSGGIGSASPLPTEICLSVCHRAWSRALTGCQAVPPCVLRVGCRCWKGRSGRSLRCLKRARHPRGTNCCGRPLPARSRALLSRLRSGGETPSPSSSARCRGERHDTEPVGRRRGPSKGSGSHPSIFLQGDHGLASPPRAGLQSPEVTHGERPKQGEGFSNEHGGDEARGTVTSSSRCPRRAQRPSAQPHARRQVGLSSCSSARDRGRGGVEGRVEKRPRQRQCAKHQGHLGEEGESSFCKRNNICGVGAEHL